MGFNKVYGCLRELFPQVDTRILRAVAIEHAKDVNAAIDDVLTDVIPFITEKTTLPSKEPCLKLPCNGEVGNKMKMDSLSCEQMPATVHVGLMESGTVSGEASNSTDQKNSSLHSDTAYLDAAPSQSVSSNDYAENGDYEQSHEITETTNLIASAKMREGNGEVGLDPVAPLKLIDLVLEDGGYDHHEQICKTTEHLEHIPLGSFENFDGDEQHNSLVIKPTLIHENEVSGSLNNFHSEFHDDLNTVVSHQSHDIESHHDSSFFKADSDSQIDPPPLVNHLLALPKIDLHPESDYQKSNASSSSNPSPKPDCSAGDISGVEDGSMGHTIITRSGQLCRVDLLDEILEDAKCNKITLFSAMEAVINKMRELEDKEIAVEKAKEEAANGGREIFVKVEEMKQMLAHAKETNDMHSGEVYGEKAILATEARELQSRLLNLSDERDKSLSILDEMHKTLEARIAAVDAMQKATLEENLANEERARNSLAEQEALMEKVVHESVILRQEAEENSKLREYLMDRGQIVDMLQGEISVICQDVRQLKEKFDERVPLSKSLSSSQTSCILASSGSSLKSMASDLVRFCSSLKDVPSDLAADQCAPSNTLKQGSPASSLNGSSPGRIGEDRERNDCTGISDDEWDLFDKDAEFAEAPYFHRKK